LYFQSKSDKGEWQRTNGRKMEDEWDRRMVGEK
jgi:hypothetical protein